MGAVFDGIQRERERERARTEMYMPLEAPAEGQLRFLASKKRKKPLRRTMMHLGFVWGPARGSVQYGRGPRRPRFPFHSHGLNVQEGKGTAARITPGSWTEGREACRRYCYLRDLVGKNRSSSCGGRETIFALRTRNLCSLSTAGLRHQTDLIEMFPRMRGPSIPARKTQGPRLPRPHGRHQDRQRRPT